MYITRVAHAYSLPHHVYQPVLHREGMACARVGSRAALAANPERLQCTTLTRERPESEETERDGSILLQQWCIQLVGVILCCTLCRTAVLFWPPTPLELGALMHYDGQR